MEICLFEHKQDPWHLQFRVTVWFFSFQCPWINGQYEVWIAGNWSDWCCSQARSHKRHKDRSWSSIAMVVHPQYFILHSNVCIHLRKQARRQLCLGSPMKCGARFNTTLAWRSARLSGPVIGDQLRCLSWFILIKDGNKILIHIAFKWHNDWLPGKRTSRCGYRKGSPLLWQVLLYSLHFTIWRIYNLLVQSEAKTLASICCL